MTKRFRLFPIVIVTALAILGLKITEIIRNDVISLDSISVAIAQEKTADKKSGMQKDAKASPNKEGSAPDSDTKESKPQKSEMKAMEAPKEKGATSLSHSEIALLEALSKRRGELDKRERELDLKTNLLKAAEKRIDDKINKLTAINEEIETRTLKQKKQRNDQFKNLVSIYEGMKPKDAARIFSKLNNEIVLQVAERIAPRKMSEILAKMEALAAQRLTIQLANQASGQDNLPKELPRIGDGKSG